METGRVRVPLHLLLVPSSPSSPQIVEYRKSPVLYSIVFS